MILDKLAVKKYYDWLDLPKAERKPKNAVLYAKMIDVNPMTLGRWRKCRAEYSLKLGLTVVEKVRPVVQLLGGMTNRATIKETARKLADGGDHKRMVELAKRLLFLIGAEDRKGRDLTDYLKSVGEFVEKKEETHIYEFTKEAEERIAKRTAQILQKDSDASSSGGTGGAKDGVQTEPILLR